MSAKTKVRKREKPIGDRAVAAYDMFVEKHPRLEKELDDVLNLHLMWYAHVMLRLRVKAKPVTKREASGE